MSDPDGKVLHQDDTAERGKVALGLACLSAAMQASLGRMSLVDRVSLLRAAVQNSDVLAANPLLSDAIIQFVDTVGIRPVEAGDQLSYVVRHAFPTIRISR